MAESNAHCELVEGRLQPKMSPKYKHSTLQLRLLLVLNQWCEKLECGRVRPEWGVVLQRRGEDWVPIPDATYVSDSRLPAIWEDDEPCPVVPELVIEIISPGQTFGELTEKATNYLLAGVDRVWVVDTKAQSVTIFRRDDLPQTVRGDETIIDPLLPGLLVPIAPLFNKNLQAN